MNLIDQTAIQSAQREQQLAADKTAQLSEMLQSMSKLQMDADKLFRRFWNRPTREEIQAFADLFPVEQLQTMFSAHAATMQLLATFFPDFRPQVPPYDFTWSATGIVIGDRKPA